MKKELLKTQKVKTSALMVLLVIGFVVSVFPVAVSGQPPAVPGWTLTVDRGKITGNPDLVEYVWNTSRPPYGPYDKIAVHRVMRSNLTAGKDVVLILPGTWSSGEQIIDVSKNGVQYATPDANRSIMLYLAERGFDMYTMDYRTHFVPNTLTPAQLSFMLNWNWTAWMGDIEAAVSLIKTVSGVSKIYIGGASFGGGAAMNYATLYQQNLKGIILLDPAWCEVAGKRGNETNSFNLNAEVTLVQMTNEYATNSTGGPNNPIWAYALAHPENTTLTDTLMAELNASGAANPYSYPWSQPAAMFAAMATMDPFWPNMLSLQSMAYMDYVHCTQTYDFDDHYINIDVPVIGFATHRFWVVVAETPWVGLFGRIEHGIASTDFTAIRLQDYGHLDVFVGTYNKEDVNDPTYQWLMAHETAQLTVASSPITGITFTINGSQETTPYTQALIKGFYALQMPAAYGSYVWSHWLEDGDTNRTKTIPLAGNTTWIAVYKLAAPPTVGGEAAPITIPISKPGLSALWIWLTTILLPLAATTIFVELKKKKR